MLCLKELPCQVEKKMKLYPVNGAHFFLDKTGLFFYKMFVKLFTNKIQKDLVEYMVTVKGKTSHA